MLIAYILYTLHVAPSHFMDYCWMHAYEEMHLIFIGIADHFSSIIVAFHFHYCPFVGRSVHLVHRKFHLN